MLNHSHALIHTYIDGSVAISHMGIEMDQGLNTKLQQLVCEELNIEPKYVKILGTSTTTTTPTSASSGFDLNAGAIKDAITNLKE